MTQISQENMFFLELYNTINELIGDQGQTLDDFLVQIEKKFPAKLQKFETIRQERSIYDVLASYGLDIEGLLFTSEPQVQQMIIGNLGHQHKQELQEEIQKFYYEIENKPQEIINQIVYDPESQQYLEIIDDQRKMAYI